jgi:hypothetical protein
MRALKGAKTVPIGAQSLRHDHERHIYARTSA